MNILLTQEQRYGCLTLIKARAEQNKEPVVKYLDLGVTVIRVICYTEEIIPVMEKQLTYVMRDKMQGYDSTIVVWKEENSGNVATELSRHLSASQKMRIRAEMLWTGKKEPFIRIVDEEGSDVIKLNAPEGVIEAYEEEQNTIYYGVENFEPEKFVKQGHCFVQIINRLVKADNVNLTHGAVFGYKGNGLLLCGRGRRGKSTLTVQSLLRGFDYVSDDYQILAEVENELRAYPIYSIVTLSYRMYNEMYNYFDGKFVCNNFNQDKYLFNISAYHKQFRVAYPVRMCLFPEIVADSRPSIIACTPEERGRAIIHLLHSTTVQMNELGDAETIRKLFDMVKELPFYKFNLCDDIEANTECLREFLCSEEVCHKDKGPELKVFSDITFGLATFFDATSCKFYAMNKFATNVYQLLCSGISADEISLKLSGYVKYNPDILREFSELQRIIDELGFKITIDKNAEHIIFNNDFAEKSGYHMSVLEYVGNEPRSII